MQGRLAARLAFVSFLAVFAGCCCCNSAALQEGVNRGMSVINVTALTAAVKSHADANNGVWPESLDDVKESIPNFDEMMKNPATEDNPGYEYVKPAEGFVPEETVVIYQLRGGARDETLESGYADGTVKVPSSPATP